MTSLLLVYGNGTMGWAKRGAKTPEHRTNKKNDLIAYMITRQTYCKFFKFWLIRAQRMQFLFYLGSQTNTVTDPISQSTLLQKVLPLLHEHARLCRKKSLVKARIATAPERIETRTADGLETVNTAEAGDYIVTNLTDAGESYVLSPETFSEKYMPVENDLYRSTGAIWALELTPEVLTALDLPDEFHFMAPWDEPMIAKAGDILACPETKKEVYRIARQEFEETYE
jgi:hypothetical protein